MKLTFSEQELIIKELEQLERRIIEAEERAVQDAGNLAVKEGRANIASAGFSSRWQTGLVQRFFPNKDTGNPAVRIFIALGLQACSSTEPRLAEVHCYGCQLRTCRLAFIRRSNTEKAGVSECHRQAAAARSMRRTACWVRCSSGRNP